MEEDLILQPKSSTNGILERSASIETLAVDEAHRREGIATSLLATLLEAFRKKGVDLVTLSVPAEEIAAIKLYGKLGFEPRAQFLWKRLST